MFTLVAQHGDRPSHTCSRSCCAAQQAHPDKALAAQLHAARPDLYKDANHKPEMAYALTDLEAMCGLRAERRAPGPRPNPPPAACRCGFRPLREIRTHLEALPELRTVVTEAGTRGWRALGCGYASVALTVLRAAAMRFLEATDPMLELDEQQAARTHLPALFTAYMNCPGGVLREQVDALVDRLQVFGAHRTADSVMLRLAAEFPGDIGIFAPYLLNVIQLRQGQAIFLAANEPHAYLSGTLPAPTPARAPAVAHGAPQATLWSAWPAPTMSCAQG